MEALTQEFRNLISIARGAFGIGLALLFAATLGAQAALGQDGDDDDEAEDESVETVVVTGSRIARQPSEVSSNIIILDQEAIRATGELTVARVLQQLPQNVNATNPTYGSKLNGRRTRPVRRRSTCAASAANPR